MKRSPVQAIQFLDKSVGDLKGELELYKSELTKLKEEVTELRSETTELQSL